MLVLSWVLTEDQHGLQKIGWQLLFVFSVYGQIRKFLLRLGTKNRILIKIRRPLQIS